MSDNMVTFDGVQVPVADVLKEAERIKAKQLERWLGIPAVAEPKPVEPGLYRLRGASDANPFGSGGLPRRKNADGSWSIAGKWGVWHPGMDCDADVREGIRVPLLPVEGVEYEGGDGYTRRWCGGEWQFMSRFGDGWLPSSGGSHLWRTGQLRPVQSEPWTPKEGEWVQHKTEPWDKVRRVTDTIGKSVRVNGAFALQAINNLRPATPDEIAAAKRIELVDRLIVRSKADGSVWQYHHRPKDWLRLDMLAIASGLSNLDLDHYDILPEYTVQGAR